MTDPNLPLIDAARDFLAVFDLAPLTGAVPPRGQLRLSAERMRSDHLLALAALAVCNDPGKLCRSVWPNVIRLRKALADELAPIVVPGDAREISTAPIRAATAKIMARANELVWPSFVVATITAILEHLDRVDDEVKSTRVLGTEAEISAMLLREFGIGHAPSSVLFVLRKLARVTAAGAEYPPANAADCALLVAFERLGKGA